jgi:hypothetical protein
MNAFSRTLQQLIVLQDRRAQMDDASQVVDVLPTPPNRADLSPQ